MVANAHKHARQQDLLSTISNVNSWNIFSKKKEKKSRIPNERIQFFVFISK